MNSNNNNINSATLIACILKPFLSSTINQSYINTIIYMSFLNGCIKHNNITLAEHCVHTILKQQQYDHLNNNMNNNYYIKSSLISLYNIYIKNQIIDKANLIQQSFQLNQIKNIPAGTTQHNISMHTYTPDVNIMQIFVYIYNMMIGNDRCMHIAYERYIAIII